MNPSSDLSNCQSQTTSDEHLPDSCTLHANTPNTPHIRSPPHLRSKTAIFRPNHGHDSQPLRKEVDRGSSRSLPLQRSCNRLHDATTHRINCIRKINQLLRQPQTPHPPLPRLRSYPPRCHPKVLCERHAPMGGIRRLLPMRIKSPIASWRHSFPER